VITWLVVTLVLLGLALAVVAGVVRWAKRHGIEPPLSSPPMGPRWLGRILPEHPRDAFIAAVVAAALFGVAVVGLGVVATDRGVYGWTLFVLAPFAMGFVAASLTTYRQEPTIPRFVLAGTFAALTAGLAFLAMGVEGVVCLLMAVPVTVPCSITGALAAYFLHSLRRVGSTAMGMIVVVVPLGLVAEPGLIGTPPPYTVRSSIDIDAPPAAVWAHLVEFDAIAAPVDTWLFRAGVTYPISARLAGERGVGATRICEFSTGLFTETVRVWEPGRRLMFTIEAGPPVLREWTPYRDLHPPHLQGYFVPESGDFRLVPLGNGKTRLEGTSVYRNHMWPSSYWRVWSDAIVAQVHRRVFQNVKQLAEGKTPGEG
jgi:hypothetical protein